MGSPCSMAERMRVTSFIAESAWGAPAATAYPEPRRSDRLVAWPRGMGSRFLQVIRHADEEIVRPRWRLTSSQRDCTFRPQSRSRNDNRRSRDGGETANSQAGKPPSENTRGISMRWITQRLRLPYPTTHEIRGGDDRMNK